MTKVHDNVDFVLAAETTVVNDTVKLIADISATIRSTDTETKFKDSVREMMSRLVPDVTWNFSNMTRSTNPSGMEQVDLQASARVSETENYSLEKRIREVSSEGLTIGSIHADTVPPTSMIEDAESKLRTLLLIKAQKELATVNETMGEHYRIGVVAFQAVNSDYSNRGGVQPMMAPQMASMKTASATPYGSGFDGDTLGNAVKLTMRAMISLRRKPTKD